MPGDRGWIPRACDPYIPRLSSRSPGDRAQAETVGFVLVFSLVVLTVALVTVAGFSELGELRTVERQDAAGRAMEGLADNVRAVATGGAPSRATEVGLSQARLYVGDPVTFRVSGERVGDPSRNFSHEVRIRPVVHETRRGGRVAYLTGAVVREEERGGSVTIRDPDWVLTGNRTVVPLVRTVPEREAEISGTDTVLVRATRNGSTVHEVTDAPYRVTLEVTSPRAKAWLASLDDRPATSCSRSGETVTCSLTTDRVVLTTVQVDVGFD